MVMMEAFANEGGLISEQVWGAADIPERELHAGRPAGSAMPLVWAHAECLKLRRCLRDGRLFDLPPQAVQRYLVEKAVSPRLVWRFNQRIRSLPAGKTLRIETLAATRIHPATTPDSECTSPICQPRRSQLCPQGIPHCFFWLRFSAFAARFSMRFFAGFFLVSFLRSLPLLIESAPAAP